MGTLPLGSMCNGSIALGEGGKVYGATRRCAPRRVSPRASASDSPHASTMSDFASATAALDAPPGFSRTIGGSTAYYMMVCWTEIMGALFPERAHAATSAALARCADALPKLRAARRKAAPAPGWRWCGCVVGRGRRSCGLHEHAGHPFRAGVGWSSQA